MASHRIFIAQPMGGRSDEEIEAERDGILQLMRDIAGPDILEVPSFFKGEARAKMHPLKMLGMALELMSEADTAVFAPGWETARGCRIEHECALQYGKHIVDLSDGQQEGDL